MGGEGRFDSFEVGFTHSIGHLGGEECEESGFFLGCKGDGLEMLGGRRDRDAREVGGVLRPFRLENRMR